MKNILILGGFGFLGKNLNQIFANSNHTIFNESRRTGCDLRIIEQLTKAISKINPDIIINAAANVGSIAYVSRYSAEVLHDNTLMYLNLFRAINETNPNIKLINPISNCSYPGIIDIQNENDWWNGPVHESVESYGFSKKLGFILSKCYARQFKVATTNLIIPNAYGPWDHLDEQKTHAMNGMIMRMIKAKNNKDEKFTIWGTGTPIREWIYMPDVARIINDIVIDDRYDLPNPINIGQEEGISINQSAQTIKKLLDCDISLINDVSKQDGAPVKILGKSLFREYFPDFVFTDYEAGIKNTIHYYEEMM